MNTARSRLAVAAGLHIVTEAARNATPTADPGAEPPCISRRISRHRPPSAGDACRSGQRIALDVLVHGEQHVVDAGTQFHLVARQGR